MKLKKLMYVVIICILFNCTEVFASTKVNIRTDEDYLVPEDVVVNESNRNSILNTPAINASEKVYDFAEVLTDAEEELIYKQIEKFVNQTNIDLVIVTIKSNPVESTKDYAHNFYNYNYFKNDGVLFLIDFDKSGIYMVTNGSAYELFPNSRMQPILKNIYNQILKKNFYGACSMFVNSISGFVGIGEVTKGEDVVIDVDGTIHKNSIVIQALVIALIGTVIGMIILVSMNKMVWPATSSREFLNKDSVVINEISDKHISSRTTKRRKNKS